MSSRRPMGPWWMGSLAGDVEDLTNKNGGMSTENPGFYLILLNHFLKKILVYDWGGGTPPVIPS